MHLYKKISTRRYIVQTAIVKVRIGSPKMAWNEQVCVHQKSYKRKIFQNIFGAIMHVRDCSCAPILWFSMWRQMAPQQTAKFYTAFLVNFLPD